MRIVGAADGDYRPWAEITEWAEEIADALRQARRRRSQCDPGLRVHLFRGASDGQLEDSNVASISASASARTRRLFQSTRSSVFDTTIFGLSLQIRAKSRIAGVAAASLSAVGQ